ncbi:MAG: hypothetical protein KGI72_05175 [Patescibacteria group bacterium]|nr:glycoside hydrolase family 25 protein [Patescibacteria group bacterium]MDE2015884.1 hypothetical protein [Patescibacteria group bacterium]MDE2233521.1 hypothetical protein [Patescibacteria group bacterium]
MIVGNDISEYQGQPDWPTLKNNANFVIIKAGEGATYIDKQFGYNRQKARDVNIPRGYYHFARPDTGNTPQQEAQFFVNLINGQPLQEGESLYLDYEVQYIGDNVGWVQAWLDFVYQKLGVKPFFYSYQSMLTSHDWLPIVNSGYPLWVAAPTGDPNNNIFKTGAWPKAAMQQWGNETVPGITTGVVDADVFFGDTAKFLSYGYHSPIQPNPPSNGQPTPPQTPPAPPSTPSTPPAVDYKQIVDSIEVIINDKSQIPWWDFILHDKRIDEIQGLIDKSTA